MDMMGKDEGTEYTRCPAVWEDPKPAGPVEVSFEFFPPKTEKAEQRLWQTVRQLTPLKPTFVSMTYGAGGSTRGKTQGIVKRINDETPLAAAAHLTCVGASRDEIDEVARSYWADGIHRIVALRGDPPADSGGYRPHPQGYAFARDLVEGLRRIADFDISVAAYPEVHPEAKSAEADLDNVKAKVDAGANRVITQYFFDPDVFLRFRDRAVAAGITVPIIAGIMPVVNFGQIVRFSQACGATIPAWMTSLFEGLDDDAETRRAVSAMMASELCRTLMANGVDEFHFYTLNRPELSLACAHAMGLRPDPATAEARDALTANV